MQYAHSISPITPVTSRHFRFINELHYYLLLESLIVYFGQAVKAVDNDMCLNILFVISLNGTSRHFKFFNGLYLFGLINVYNMNVTPFVATHVILCDHSCHLV